MTHDLGIFLIWFCIGALCAGVPFIALGVLEGLRVQDPAAIVWMFVMFAMVVVFVYLVRLGLS